MRKILENTSAEVQVIIKMMKRLIFLFLICLDLGILSAEAYTLSICAIFQDEAPYLKEWIEFHKLVGVEHFYLYNHCSTDHYKDVLEPYIRSGIVELEEKLDPATDIQSFNPLQCGCYTECLKKANGVSKWVAFIDIDEYLFPIKQQQLLPDLLKQYEEFGGVCVNWLMFGTSNVKKIPSNRLLIECLTQCTDKFFWGNRYVKSIVRPQRASHFTSPHFPIYLDGHYQVNTDKLRFEGDSSVYIQTNKMRVNHYWTKDEEFFYNKKIRRQKNWGGTPEPEKILQNMNAKKDTLILRYVPALTRQCQTF